VLKAKKHIALVGRLIENFGVFMSASITLMGSFEPEIPDQFSVWLDKTRTKGRTTSMTDNQDLVLCAKVY